ncbi:tetratricopeptide repeat protein [Anaerolineae bacterium CFX7]|nr:tetratricopeptide repeat protein [Anaerolineae bacterium CFX7]
MPSKSKAASNTSPVLTPEQAIEKYSTEAASQATAANYLELGAAYYVAHRWQDAIQAFEKTITLDPNQAFAHFYLGILYASQGQREKADAALAKVLQVSANQMLKEQAQARIPHIQSVADLGN